MNSARLAPIFRAKNPNRKPNGTPMNCVMRSAPIIAFSSIPISVPYVVAIRMIVWIPSL